MEDHRAGTTSGFARQECNQVLVDPAIHFMNSGANGPLQIGDGEWPHGQRGDIEIRVAVE
jgi:hypothetical protein